MAPRPFHFERSARLARRCAAVLPAVVVVAIGLLAARAAWPAPAQAVDLFPVDDWLGKGLREAGEIALGPVKFGAEEIAKLLATVVGALADLLVPKSLVRAGVDGVRWLVSLPAVGAAAVPTGDGGYVLAVRMPHVVELRHTLTWIGVTLLPVGLVLAGGRAILAPTSNGEGPAEILVRVCAAGLALISYDLVWALLTRLSRLVTNGLLGLPWVDDGIERMLETLLIGGAAGTAVAAEFVIPLLILFAGGALLALLLLRVGLEVATALLYVLGGLVLGLSPTTFGRRLLTGWLFAATAIVVLPVLWTIVFVTGAALMLDAGSGPGGGLGKFVAQLFNVAAAAAVFSLAIKLGLGVFQRAQSSIASLGGTTLASGPAGMPRAAAGSRGATPAGVPASLAAFSQNLRSSARGVARTVGGVVALPVRHPVAAAQGARQAARHPVQATQHAASDLRTAVQGKRAAPAVPAGTAPTGIKAAPRATERTDNRQSPLRIGGRPEHSGQSAPRAPARAEQSDPSTLSRAGQAARQAEGPLHSAASDGARGRAPVRPVAARMQRPPTTQTASGPVASVAFSAVHKAAGAPSSTEAQSGRPATTPARSKPSPRPATAPPKRAARRTPRSTAPPAKKRGKTS